MKNDTDREQRPLVILEVIFVLLAIGIAGTGYLAYHDSILVFGALLALVGARLALIRREQSVRQHRQRDETTVALRKNTQILHESQSIAHLASWTADLRTGVFEAASGGSHLLAWMAGTHTLADLLAMIHPDDREYVRSAWLAAMRGAPYDIEYRIILDGEVRWISIKAKITYDQQRNPYSAMGILQDITERKQGEEALRQGEIRFKAMIEHAPGAITLVDADGRLKFVSASTQRVMGYHPDAMLGRNPAELTHPEDLLVLVEILTDLAQHPGQVRTVTYRFRHQDVSWRWVESTMSNLLHEPSVNGIAFNFHDITERKQIEQELLELNRTLEERVNQRSAEVQDLYENAPNGYHSLDLNGNITRVNQTELTWLGYSREELIGSRFTDLITERSQILFQENYALFKERGWVRGLEYECIRKDGATFNVLLDATAIYDAQGTYLMSRSTMVDDTVRKQAKDALHRANAELERAARAKDEFLANMSHELRTPRVQHAGSRHAGAAGPAGVRCPTLVVAAEHDYTPVAYKLYPPVDSPAGACYCRRIARQVGTHHAAPRRSRVNLCSKICESR